MTNDNSNNPRSTSFEENEALMRIFLRHRFGIDEKEVNRLNLHKNEELHYHLVLEELKKALKTFLDHPENVDKLVHHIKSITSQPESIISDSDIKVQYHINIKQLIQAVVEEIQALSTQDYINKIPKRLKNKGLVCIALKTQNGELEGSKNESQCHIKGIVFFDEKLLKLNRFDIHKNPSIIIYKIQNFDPEKLEPIITRLLKSFEEPLEHHLWDKELNEILQLEKTNKIIKKEHAIGNCGWITAKMMVYSIVYGIIFQSLKELGAKDIVANKIAIAIAEYWYRLFTLDDRNRSLYAYFTKHGFKTSLEPVSMKNRVKMLKEFLANPPLDSDYDKELVNTIYAKSLNWLLDECLKNGDIGAARQMLQEEMDNTLFNPLFFAARNDKTAIAELLAGKPHFVHDRDGDGNTPFLIASAKGNIDICKILLKHQKRNLIDISVRNSKGQTAMHLAVINKRREMIEYLISLDPSLIAVKDNHGKDPLQIATDHGYLEIEKILKKGSQSLKGQQHL